MNEAEFLFTEILNCNRLSLYLNNKDLPWDKNNSFLIASILKERILGRPLQYILGKTEFMGLEFKLTPDVFIPRPETEILVETVVELVSSVMCHVSCVRILDLGTGSGCMAISLAKFLQNVDITATDISYGAIEIAQYNAILNNITDKIRFIHSNLFDSYELGVRSYDIIVSNPPYIPTQDISTLDSEVKHEPRIALDGGAGGLDFYRKIVTGAGSYLKEDGYLIMEIGFGQKDAVENIFQESGNFKILEVIKDYKNIDRVIVGQKNKKNG